MHIGWDTVLKCMKIALTQDLRMRHISVFEIIGETNYYVFITFLLHYIVTDSDKPHIIAFFLDLCTAYLKNGSFRTSLAFKMSVLEMPVKNLCLGPT